MSEGLSTHSHLKVNLHRNIYSNLNCILFLIKIFLYQNDNYLQESVLTENFHLLIKDW